MISRIRTVAKKLKSSRKKLRMSSDLDEINQEVDQLIESISKIEDIENLSINWKPRHRTARNSKKNLSSSRRRASLRNGLRSLQNSRFNLFKAQRQRRQKLKRDRKGDGTRSETHAKINKSMGTSESPRRCNDTRKIRDPLKITNELEKISQAIADLEREKKNTSFHKYKKQRMKSLMQNSRIQGIRRSLSSRLKLSKEDKPERDILLSGDIDKSFVMKKCSTCFLYFPLDKIQKHLAICNVKKKSIK